MAQYLDRKGTVELWKQVKLKMMDAVNMKARMEATAGQVTYNTTPKYTSTLGWNASETTTQVTLPNPNNAANYLKYNGAGSAETQYVSFDITVTSNAGKTKVDLKQTPSGSYYFMAVVNRQYEVKYTLKDVDTTTITLAAPYEGYSWGNDNKGVVTSQYEPVKGTLTDKTYTVLVKRAEFSGTNALIVKASKMNPFGDTKAYSDFENETNCVFATSNNSFGSSNTVDTTSWGNRGTNQLWVLTTASSLDGWEGALNLLSKIDASRIHKIGSVSLTPVQSDNDTNPSATAYVYLISLTGEYTTQYGFTKA